MFILKHKSKKKKLIKIILTVSGTDLTKLSLINIRFKQTLSVGIKIVIYLCRKNDV